MSYKATEVSCRIDRRGFLGTGAAPGRGRNARGRAPARRSRPKRPRRTSFPGGLWAARGSTCPC